MNHKKLLVLIGWFFFPFLITYPVARESGNLQIVSNLFACVALQFAVFFLLIGEHELYSGLELSVEKKTVPSFREEWLLRAILNRDPRREYKYAFTGLFFGIFLIAEFYLAAPYLPKRSSTPPMLTLLLAIHLSQACMGIWMIWTLNKNRVRMQENIRLLASKP
jgi:heme A synthase